jgi:hypothetical protein
VRAVRKISILDESYMALEGNIAEAIDAAAEIVEESKSEAGSLFDSIMSKVQDKVNFHTDPEFINFKNDPSLNLRSIGDVLAAALPRALDMIETTNAMSLEDVAMMSKAYAELTGIDETTFNDEIEEAVHFFGRDNTDIPDSAENVFVVRISDAAKHAAIEKMISVQSILASSVNAMNSLMDQGGSPEMLKSSMEKIWLVKALLDPMMK